ncbi:MAG: hypothetical protein U5K36_11405 [Roseovarius sp.]|nr:hypothetical protein [Roseovarius sp.]
MGRLQNLSAALDPETGAFTLPRCRLRAAQVAQFWQFLENGIAAAEGGIRATLAALPVAP